MRKNILFLLITICSIFLLTSCGNKDEDKKTEETPVHEHTYSSEWEYNANDHWHKASCEHENEVSGKAPHEWVETSRVDATCQEDGVITFACVCGNTKTEYISMLDHVVNDVEVYGHDEKQHWVECATCGEPLMHETHTFTLKSTNNLAEP